MHRAVTDNVNPGPPALGGGHDGRTQFGVHRPPVWNARDQHEYICILDSFQVTHRDRPDILRPVVTLCRRHSGGGRRVNCDRMAPLTKLGLHLLCPLPFTDK